MNLNEYELKKYLEYAIYLEKEKYIQMKVCNRYQQEMKLLGVRKNITAPVRKEEESVLGNGILIFLGIAICVGIPFSIIFCGVIINGFMGGNANFGHVALLSIAIGGIPAILAIVGAISSNGEIEEKYHKEMEAYTRKWQAENARMEKENQKKSILDRELNKMKKQYSEISNVLNTLYSLNVLYPKYRNIVAIVTFYEYLISGRCSQLEGHEGAYNIYENEIRMNAIINRLDDIICHLEEIKNSQYLIYNTLKESNRKVDSLYKTATQNLQYLQDIAANSSITAYHAEISAKNSEILSYIAICQSVNK